MAHLLLRCREIQASAKTLAGGWLLGDVSSVPVARVLFARLAVLESLGSCARVLRVLCCYIDIDVAKNVNLWGRVSEAPRLH